MVVLAPQRNARRGRPKILSDDQRRRQILKAAYAIFMEVGYSSTSIDAVVRKCRISKQTFYRIFADKSELFVDLITDHRRTMLDLPRPSDEDVAADIGLARIFGVDLDEAADFERHRFVHQFLKEAHKEQEAVALLRKYGIDKAQADLSDWLAEQCRKGVLEMSDTLHAAAILMEMIFGPMSNPYLDPEHPSIYERRKHIRICINLFLNGAIPSSSSVPFPARKMHRKTLTKTGPV
ncbi:TetR/AcrR family transcriptional regulator [Rhizobium sp. AG207R]|uniref:TetR/AcrR family transcriptional regulator n=1 Tax=Rhizobium sp. AG207R TaxID=2802287 RepID=UPI0022AC453E|nr:TetR/AcrR family transcriptional regulator [Rhizobium sp. AG207R]MCZ3374323.1 TetR/AcrR family transcriptional regulator [Rhizobium sp. AG207R]